MNATPSPASVRFLATACLHMSCSTFMLRLLDTNDCNRFDERGMTVLGLVCQAIANGQAPNHTRTQIQALLARGADPLVGAPCAYNFIAMLSHELRETMDRAISRLKQGLRFHPSETVVKWLSTNRQTLWETMAMEERRCYMEVPFFRPELPSEQRRASEGKPWAARMEPINARRHSVATTSVPIRATAPAPAPPQYLTQPVVTKAAVDPRLAEQRIGPTDVQSDMAVVAVKRFQATVPPPLPRSDPPPAPASAPAHQFTPTTHPPAPTAERFVIQTSDCRTRRTPTPAPVTPREATPPSSAPRIRFVFKGETLSPQPKHLPEVLRQDVTLARPPCNKRKKRARSSSSVKRLRSDPGSLTEMAFRRTSDFSDAESMAEGDVPYEGKGSSKSKKQSKKKKKSTQPLTEGQEAEMEKIWKAGVMTPDPELRKKLSAKLDVEIRQIQTWFGAKRAADENRRAAEAEERKRIRQFAEIVRPPPSVTMQPSIVFGPRLPIAPPLPRSPPLLQPPSIHRSHASDDLPPLPGSRRPDPPTRPLATQTSLPRINRMSLAAITNDDLTDVAEVAASFFGEIEKPAPPPPCVQPPTLSPFLQPSISRYTTGQTVSPRAKFLPVGSPVRHHWYQEHDIKHIRDLRPPSTHESWSRPLDNWASRHPALPHTGLPSYRNVENHPSAAIDVDAFEEGPAYGQFEPRHLDTKQNYAMNGFAGMAEPRRPGTVPKREDDEVSLRSEEAVLYDDEDDE